MTEAGNTLESKYNDMDEADKPEEEPNHEPPHFDEYEFVGDIKYSPQDTENGLFAYLGCDDLSVYTNPCDTNTVNIDCSPLKKAGMKSKFISLKHDPVYSITRGRNKEDPPYFTVNIKDKYLIPTHYSLKNYSNGHIYWNRGWRLEASNDGGLTWNELDLIMNNDQLKGAGKICSFKLENKVNCLYNMFRIQTTSGMNDESWEMGLSGFELYGKLYTKHVSKTYINIKYNHDIEDNSDGLFSYLSKECGPDSFQVSSSKLKNKCNPLSFIGLKHKVSYTITEQNEKAYFSVYLTENRYFKPIYYALRNYVNGDSYWNRGWSLEASKDGGRNWDVLDLVQDNHDLKGRATIAYYPIHNKNLTDFVYNEFRVVIQETMNDLTSWQLGISGFELYGELYSQTAHKEIKQKEHKAEEKVDHDDFIIDLKYNESNKKECGLFYFLGTNYSKSSEYQNPALIPGAIHISTTQLKGSSQKHSLIGLHQVHYCVLEKTQIDPSFTVDLRDAYIAPTHYAFRNYSNGNSYWNRGWNLEGSCDGGTIWESLSKITDNSQLKGKGNIVVFDIDNKDSNQCYNLFRITSTQTMNDNSCEFALSGFELYGRLYSNQILYDNHVNIDVNCDSLTTQYDANNPQNGLFNYLQTNYGKNAYKVKSSALKSKCKNTHFVGLTHGITYTITKPNEYNYYAVYLQKGSYINPTHYALRNYSNGHKYWMTGWNLEGKTSNNDEWEIIDDPRDNNELKGKGQILIREIQSNDKYYNQFRIIMKQPMNDNSWELGLSGMEVYGQLYPEHGVLQFLSKQKLHYFNQMIHVEAIVDDEDDEKEKQDEGNTTEKAGSDIGICADKNLIDIKNYAFRPKHLLLKLGSIADAKRAQFEVSNDGNVWKTVDLNIAGIHEKQSTVFYEIADCASYYSKFRSDGVIQDMFGNIFVDKSDFIPIKDIDFNEAHPSRDGVFDYLSPNISASSSPLKRDQRCVPSMMIGLKQPVIYLITKPNKNAFFSISCTKGTYVTPSYYALKNYCNGDSYWNRGWNVEGSYNSGKTWDLLDEIKNSDALKGKGRIAYFKITTNHNRYYNSFRVRITQGMNDNSWELGLNGFELFGKMYKISNTTRYISTFKYVKDNEAENGLFYGLANIGKYEGNKPSLNKNAAESGIVIVKSAPMKNKKSTPATCFVGISHDVGYTVTIARKHAYAEINLKNRLFTPTAYVLRNYINGDKYYLMGWNIEGSNDGKSWDIIDTQTDSKVLLGVGKICYFPIVTALKQSYYSKYRIIMTQQLNDKSWELAFSGMELYGHLYHEVNDEDSKYNNDYICECVYNENIGIEQGFVHKMNPLCNIFTVDGGMNNMDWINDKIDTATSDTMGSWFAINFNEYKVLLTHYTLKHCRYDENALKSWRLEGGNDGDNWQIISIHNNDTDLSKTGASKTFPVRTFSYFNYFRIVMLNKNCSGNWKLCVGDIDFYGHIISTSNTKKCYKLCGYGSTNMDNITISTKFDQWFEEEQKISFVDDETSAFLKISPLIPNSTSDTNAFFNFKTMDGEYLFSKLIHDMELNKVNVIHLYGPSNEKRATAINLKDYRFENGAFRDNDNGADERQINSLQYDYIGHYFVLLSGLETDIDFMNNTLYNTFDENRLKLMRNYEFMWRNMNTLKDITRDETEYLINVDIYNADIRTLAPNNEFQVKILLNTLHDKIWLDTDFVAASDQDPKSGLFHLDWYQNVKTTIKTTLKPQYIADIIIQLKEKKTANVLAYTRLNFEEMLTDKYQQLISYELINLEFKKNTKDTQRVAQMLLEFHIIDTKKLSKHNDSPSMQRPLLQFESIQQVINNDNTDDVLSLQLGIRFPKNMFDEFIDLIPIIKLLLDENKKSHNEALSYLAEKFIKQFEGTTDHQYPNNIQQTFAICTCAHTEHTKHDTGYCYIDMMESRLKSQHIPINSHIDDIFAVFAYNESESFLLKLLKTRLNEWNKDPNDLKRNEVAFSINKELIILIKILIHRSSNPLNTALQIADNLTKSLEIYKRIEDEINDLIELTQIEAISFLDSFGSNRSKHIALETGETMELALDNELTTFITSEHVALFRHWKWTENPSTIITDSSIDFQSNPEDELAVWFNSFFGSFISAFTTYEDAKTYFFSLKQQEKYFYSPIGLYQFEFCLFLIYIVFLYYVGMNTRYLFKEDVSVAEIIFYIINLCFVSSEAFEIATGDKDDYFSDTNNWIDLIMDACFMLLLILRLFVYAQVFECDDDNLSHCSGNTLYLVIWFFLIITVTLRILHLSYVFESMGMLIKNIVLQSKDLVNFVIVMLAFSFSYGIAIYICIGDDICGDEEECDLSQHSHPLKSVRAMFFGILDGVDYSIFTDASITPFLSLWLQMFTLLFSIVAVLILLNLIIAVMSGTYEAINESAKQDVMYYRMLITHQKSKTPPILSAPFQIIIVVISCIISCNCCRKQEKIYDREEIEERYLLETEKDIETETRTNITQINDNKESHIPHEWICCHCFHQNDVFFEAKNMFDDHKNENININIQDLHLISVDEALLKRLNPTICSKCLRPKQNVKKHIQVLTAKISFSIYCLFSLLFRYLVILPLLIIYHIIVFVLSSIKWLICTKKGEKKDKFVYYYFKKKDRKDHGSNFEFRLFHKKNSQKTKQSYKVTLQSYE